MWSRCRKSIAASSGRRRSMSRRNSPDSQSSSTSSSERRSTIRVASTEISSCHVFRSPRRRIHLFPNTAAAEQRGAVEAEIAPPGGQSFRLFATHLDFGRKEASEADRQGAIKLVNECVSSRPASLRSSPVTTTASRRAGRSTRFASPGCSRTRADAFTTPVDTPTRQIDFIFLRPKDRWKVIDVKVLDEAVASDHRPDSRDGRAFRGAGGSLRGTASDRRIQHEGHEEHKEHGDPVRLFVPFVFFVLIVSATLWTGTTPNRVRMQRLPSCSAWCFPPMPLRRMDRCGSKSSVTTFITAAGRTIRSTLNASRG